jgi:predicted MFS family arabinose efflux permease
VGLFHVTFGVGFFIGAIIAKEWATRIGWGCYTMLMGLAAVIEGLFVVLFSRVDTFMLALLLLSIAYMGRSIVITLFNTISSRLIDERFKGRYFALNRVFSYTAMGVTMLLCGYGLSLFSARQLAFFAGVFLFINGVSWVIIIQKTPKAVFEFSE